MFFNLSAWRVILFQPIKLALASQLTFCKSGMNFSRRIIFYVEKTIVDMYRVSRGQKHRDSSLLTNNNAFAVLESHFK